MRFDRLPAASVCDLSQSISTDAGTSGDHAHSRRTHFKALCVLVDPLTCAQFKLVSENIQSSGCQNHVVLLRPDVKNLRLCRILDDFSSYAFSFRTSKVCPPIVWKAGNGILLVRKIQPDRDRAVFARKSAGCLTTSFGHSQSTAKPLNETSISKTRSMSLNLLIEQHFDKIGKVLDSIQGRSTNIERCCSQKRQQRTSRTLVPA